MMIQREEVRLVAELYASLIVAGKRTFASVPKTQQAKVRDILVATGNEELAV